MSPAEHVSKLLHGEQSLESYAAEHRLSVDELRTWKALYLAGGDAAFAKKPARRWLVPTVAITAAALVPLTVFAQTVCSPTLPAPLTTFCSGTPANASQVNGNFAVLAAKVMGTQPDGGTYNGDIVQASGAWIRGLTANGDVRLQGNGVRLQGPAGDGRPLVIEGGDVLALGTDFTATRVTNTLNAGTTNVSGPLAINGGASVSGISVGVSGNELRIGETTPGGANLGVWGELRASSIRNRGCYWADGAPQQLNTWSQATCGGGYYVQSTRCMVPGGWYIQCQAYCCLP